MKPKAKSKQTVAKRAYILPRLKKLGMVKNLTCGGGSDFADANGLYPSC